MTKNMTQATPELHYGQIRCANCRHLLFFGGGWGEVGAAIKPRTVSREEEISWERILLATLLGERETKHQAINTETQQSKISLQRANGYCLGYYMVKGQSLFSSVTARP